MSSWQIIQATNEITFEDPPGDTELAVGDKISPIKATAKFGLPTYSVTGDAITVSDNILTAVKQGTATLSAHVDGTSNYTAADASVIITVKGGQNTYVLYNGAWHKADAYIKHNGTWLKANPYILNR